MKTIAELEAFIDERLEAFRQRPRMWGDPFSLECECLLLIELYLRFCHPTRDWREVAPSGVTYQTFAFKRLPNRPEPMTLAQWFTDKKYGTPEARDFEDDEDEELLHWAGMQIAEFFIAWKSELSLEI